MRTQLFASAGCRLALADRDAKALEATVTEVNLPPNDIMSVVLDITDDGVVTSFVRSIPEHFGRLDVAL